MRTQRSFQLYSVILLCLSTFVTAWPWPKWLPELDSIIVVRQDDTSSQSSAADNTASATATATTTATAASRPTNTASETGSQSSDSKSTTKTSSQTGSNSATTSGSKTTKTGSSHSNSTIHHTTYNATYAAGGISLMTPAAASTTYFKIGDYITFAWNFTSLQATPTAVNIMATCKANAQLYTIATNQTVTNSVQAVTWDTSGYQATAVTNPLLTETYTLIIYDAESSISATPEAGYLSTYNQYSFGMYVPQPYAPLNDWVCATCSGALSDMERQALRLMFTMGFVTVLSFTWFVTGLDVIW
ncbi:55db521f-8c59-43b5-a31f-d2954f8a6df9 [Sclerotinia trifoliorum]|uniref:55db521f-8c59-43b5-a31f-d2954f8a6df9 n=1 Tax=Sclerotinia trifoliorum TaxID=28548 RepID=A0A8H2ZLF4_9HELO|nr:55db521f-8c59-43b5-a31f-d2954f8a6df9 [Sclerotinia trifoliorum]